MLVFCADLKHANFRKLTLKNLYSVYKVDRIKSSVVTSQFAWKAEKFKLLTHSIISFISDNQIILYMWKALNWNYNSIEFSKKFANIDVFLFYFHNYRINLQKDAIYYYKKNPHLLKKYLQACNFSFYYFYYHAQIP